jgi:hypothetical protein
LYDSIWSAFQHDAIIGRVSNLTKQTAEMNRQAHASKNVGRSR